MFLWWEGAPRAEKVDEAKLGRIEAGLRTSPTRNAQSRRSPTRLFLGAGDKAAPPAITDAGASTASDRPLPQRAASPASISRAKWSKFQVVESNHEIADDTRAELELTQQMGDIRSEGLHELFSEMAAYSRMESQLAVPLARDRVVQEKHELVEAQKRTRKGIQEAKRRTMERISQWGKQAKAGDDMQKLKVEQSKAEVTLKNKASALQLAAEQSARKAFADHEAAELLRRKRGAIEQIQSETGKEAREESQLYYFGMKQDSADLVRNEKEQINSYVRSKKAYDAKKRHLSPERLTELDRRRGKTMGSPERRRQEKMQDAAGVRESLRNVQQRDQFQRLENQKMKEASRDKVMGEERVEGEEAAKVMTSTWNVLGEQPKRDLLKKREKEARMLLQQGARSVGDAAKMLAPSSSSSSSSSALPSRQQSRRNSGYLEQRRERRESITMLSPLWRGKLTGSAASSGDDQPVVMDDTDLRRALRQVFDKFDEDGSGAVSIMEMSKIIKECKMEVPAEKLKRMMHESDPDGSGDIDFEEFVHAVKKQVAEGRGGGLADLVKEASGILGFFTNVFSLFSTTAKKAAAATSAVVVATSTTNPHAPTALFTSPQAGGGEGGMVAEEEQEEGVVEGAADVEGSEALAIVPAGEQEAADEEGEVALMSPGAAAAGALRPTSPITAEMAV